MATGSRGGTSRTGCLGSGREGPFEALEKLDS